MAHSSASSHAITAERDIAAPTDVTSASIDRIHDTGRHLKILLKGLDSASLLAGWGLAYQVIAAVSPTDASDRAQSLVLALVGWTAALLTMASKRLWLARVCAVRSAELAGLGTTAFVSCVVSLAAGQLLDLRGHDRLVLLGAFLAFVLMTAGRVWYGGWLKRARRRGRFSRRLVLVGGNPQSFELADLLARHPETGFELTGVCGPRELAGDGSPLPWLGDYDDAAAAVAGVGATGALVVASALDPTTLNRTLRSLLGAGCHVHVSSALSGFSHGRLLPMPLAREPLFYLERRALTRSQLALKRATDVTVGLVLTLVSLPVLTMLALAIKLDDGGPVLFRQRRIGYRGKPFTLYKLRTMVPDAEARLGALQRDNQRVGGPLFKAAHDPRVTRLGWWLRATSLDELPQLINVMKGDMSLVGPRPALPHEVAQFDPELRQRGRMMPGITGLWQVEGRDDASFDTYRRLDLFYVENWSIGLDLAILGTTAGAVARRGLQMVLRRDGAA